MTRTSESKQTWHVVTSQGGIVCGVFGFALLGMAQESAKQATAQTGFPAWVEQVHGVKPQLGSSLR